MEIAVALIQAICVAGLFYGLWLSLTCAVSAEEMSTAWHERRRAHGTGKSSPEPVRGTHPDRQRENTLPS